MSYIERNKLCFYLNRLKNPMPITADIVLTNKCNLKCEYCRYEKGNDHMSTDLFSKIVDRLIALNVKGIILTGGGEPMLHERFDEIINILQDKKMPFGLNTNLPNVCRTNAAWVKVSAHNQNNLQAFNDMRKLNPDSTMGLQGIVKSPDEVFSIYNKIKELPADYIAFRPIESTEKVYDSELVVGIRNSIKALQSTDNRVSENYKWDMVFDSFSRCISNWTNLFINYDGIVWYCCHKEEVVGHILDGDVIEKKSKHITNMSTCEKPCRLSGSNKYLQSLPSHHLEFI